MGVYGGRAAPFSPTRGLGECRPLQPPPSLLPLQAVAAVCGFLIAILLCLICFFAQKTRSKIWRYGKANIYWDRAPVVQEGPDVEEWVSIGGQWEHPPPTLSRLGAGNVAVPHIRSSSCHKQCCTRSRGAELLPQPTLLFPFSGPKGKQGWIRWAGGQQC